MLYKATYVNASLNRDLQDIGCYIKVIDGCQQLDKETRYGNNIFT